MTPELNSLTLAALLQMVQFLLYAIAANRDLGPRYAMSSRDNPPEKEMTERTARLTRAFQNHFEGLLLFAVAVGVIQMSSQNTGLTALCAWAYLIARVLYVPAYVYGLNPWRSLIWGVSFLATLLMLLAALF